MGVSDLMAGLMMVFLFIAIAFMRYVQVEQERIKDFMGHCVTALTNPRLKDQIEFTMGEGLCLIIENVENEVDPMLDPVMEKAIIKKGKNMYRVLAGSCCRPTKTIFDH